MTTLYVREGSQYREAETGLVLSAARTLISQKFRAGITLLNKPEHTAEFLNIHLASLDYEVFGILHLNMRHRLLAMEELFRGTLDGATVYPREVVKSVIKHGSASVILFHNHPSGDAAPSLSDERVTARLQSVLRIIDVRLLDHLIVGERIFSFAEHGLLPKGWGDETASSSRGPLKPIALTGSGSSTAA